MCLVCRQPTTGEFYSQPAGCRYSLYTSVTGYFKGLSLMGGLSDNPFGPFIHISAVLGTACNVGQSYCFGPDSNITTTIEYFVMEHSWLPSG